VTLLDSIPAADGDLRVMTFNVRRRLDGPFAWPPADRWSTRRARVERMLQRERPTLLGVQEALPGQAATIVGALGAGYRYVGVGRGRGGRGEGCPVFYDAERLELHDAEQITLSDRPAEPGSRTWGNMFPRVLVRAVFTDLVSGARFVAVNTHLDPVSARSRVRSTADIRRRVGVRGLPTVVMGDMNADADSPTARELFRDGVLRDAWTAADQRVTPEWGTHAGYREPREGSRRIDWIAVTATVGVRAIGIDARRVDGGWPSDHLPVQALLRFPHTAGGAT
jgi:endonuclease/exonuclease/phosphatase family metal-dependent hydrolase